MSPRLSLLTSSLLLWTACATPNQQLKQYQEREQVEDQHLKEFDTLDFDVFTHQKWDELAASHAKDIIVHWPDGHETRGIDVHIADLKAMFVFAPDMRIRTHPVRIASKEWTSVVGVMEGTFTQPMPLPGGKSIPPTGKALKLEMNTLGRWKDGVMVEEYLFWDNQAFLQQLGLAK